METKLITTLSANTELIANAARGWIADLARGGADAEIAVSSALSRFEDLDSLPHLDHSALVETLISAGRESYVHGRRRRVFLGHIGNLLHKLTAKPGYGHYMDVIGRMGIPYTTMQDYRAEAAAEDEGRSREIRKDDLESPEQEQAQNLVSEPVENPPDAYVLGLRDALDEARAEVDEASEKGTPLPTKTLRLVLDVERHKTVHAILADTALRQALGTAELNDTAYEAFRFTYRRLVQEGH